MNPSAHEELESYLRGFLARMGPRSAVLSRQMADLLDEFRDHLTSHVEQLIEYGYPERDAARRAVHEFGDPDQIARGVRRELLRRPLRRLCLTLTLGGLILGGCWHSVVLLGPPAPWRDDAQPLHLALFDNGSDLTSAGAIGLAAISLLLLVVPLRVRAGRSHGAGWERAAQRWAHRFCLASLGLGAFASAQVAAYLVGRGMLNDHSIAWPWVVAATVLTVIVAASLIAPLRAIMALR